MFLFIEDNFSLLVRYCVGEHHKEQKSLSWVADYMNQMAPEMFRPVPHLSVVFCFPNLMASLAIRSISAYTFWLISAISCRAFPRIICFWSCKLTCTCRCRHMDLMQWLMKNIASSSSLTVPELKSVTPRSSSWWKEQVTEILKCKQRFLKLAPFFNPFSHCAGWCGAGADHYEPLLARPSSLVSPEKVAVVL